MEHAGTTPAIDRIRDVLLNTDQLRVLAECKACGHVSVPDWEALSVGYSEERSLRSLGRKIRCKECGARGCDWHVMSRTSIDQSGTLINRQIDSGAPGEAEKTIRLVAT